MEAYTDFAYVYDTFMDDTPYEEWSRFIQDKIKQYGISRPEKTENVLESEKNLVLDLGCGTGTLTQLLAEAGYDMIGVDNSGDMLTIAKEKSDRSGHEVLYLQQDMRELDLYSTIGTVISVCDSLNYLLTEEDLLKTFSLVKNFLYPGGIFLFDFNTVYKYAEVIGEATIAENREECSFIWENYYYPDEQINEYDVTVFVKEKEDLYRKFTETHYQRGYTLMQMESLIRKAGLHILEVMDADSKGPVTDQSERIYVIAKKSGENPAVQNAE